MTQDQIEYRVSGKRASITLNRPDKSNALNGDMLLTLRDRFRKLSADTNIHALMITGAGHRSFCGGADLGEPDTMRNSALWDEVSGELSALPILSVALINGACIGGGMTLALGCDVRMGVPHSRFAYPVLRNRILPTRRDVDKLNALIGPGRTAMILLGGATVSSEEAHHWGLLDRVESSKVLLEEGSEICQAACEVERKHVVKFKAHLKDVAL